MKKEEKLNLDPNEMAVRKIYWDLVEQRSLKTFFRPGVRLCSDYRGYCKHQDIVLRCIDRLGSDQLGIAPVFAKDKEAFVIIESIYSKKIKDLSKEDFKGSSPDVQDKLSLKYHLGMIYNMSFDRLSDESYVTVIKIKYKKREGKLEAKERLENLVQNGAWGISKLSSANPKDFSGESLMVTLVSHDYPARTPLLWNTAFKHFKINAKSIVLDYRKEERDILELKRAFKIFKEDGRLIAGGIGVGFKDQSLSLFDKLDPAVVNSGSSNFFEKKAGELIAHNTDGKGFVYGLRQSFPEFKELTGKKVLLLGSGGTANAISFALASFGAKLIIANRTRAKAVALAERINEHYRLSLKEEALVIAEDELAEHLEGLSLIVNTSTKGAAGIWQDYSALSSTEAGLSDNLAKSKALLKKLSKDVLISDIILREKDTPLISQAKELGLRSLDGLPMVISQAVLAFYLSLGKDKGIGFEEIYQVMLRAANNE